MNLGEYTQERTAEDEDSRQRDSRCYANCRKWLESELGVKLEREAIAAMLMPFRVAQRLSLLATVFHRQLLIGILIR